MRRNRFLAAAAVASTLCAHTAWAQTAVMTATDYVAGYRSNYSLTKNVEGTVTLLRLRDNNIETLPHIPGQIKFQDAYVSFDTSGIPGQVYRLYQAAFNREPDLVGLGYWIDAMQRGVSLEQVASDFYSSAEFQNTYGEVTDLEFLTLIYRNVLKRAPDQEGQAFWLNSLKLGITRAIVLHDFSQGKENKDNVAAAIANGITYLPWGGSDHQVPIQGYAPPATPVSGHAITVKLTTADMLGHYARHPVENGYHEGDIIQQADGRLGWKNQATAVWNLVPDLDRNILVTDKTNPYYKSRDGANIGFGFVGGKIAGIYVNGEFFLREGVTVPAGVTPMRSIAREDVGLYGFAWHEVNAVPSEYRYGFSMYAAMWPMIDYTMAQYQIGMGFFVMPDNTDYTQALLPPDNKMRMGTPNSGPTWAGYFQTMEGGQGGWHNTQFPVKDPKFMIVGTPDGYASGGRAPGFGFAANTAVPHSANAIAQLSNRLLAPPDGYTFKSGTKGEFFGYSWMALPLTAARQTTVPIGEHSWTLFFNATNFSGPTVFWIPDAWARLSKTWAPAIARGLDARLANVAGTTVEINTTTSFSNADAKGELYLRNARLLFAVDANDTSYISADRTHYGAAALFEPVRQWLNGGPAVSGTFARAGSYFPTSRLGGFDLKYDGKKVVGLDRYVSPKVFKTPGGGEAFGLQWTRASTPGVLPEYYHQVGDTLEIVDASAVPPETALSVKDFTAPVRGASYTSPSTGSESWFSPAPAAGPFTATLTDGSVVTYYWYKFIDQPSLQGFGWSSEEKLALQAKVEKLHRGWANTSEFMAPPTAGALATLDASLLVTPPAGMEAGYVPIVTQQNKAP